MATTQPVPVNVYETTHALVIVGALPGVMADDITVDLEPGRVTIRAGMRTPAPKDYLTREWHYGPYERTVEVPEGYGADATASHGNGMLAISLGRGDPGGATQVPVHGA